MTAPRNRRSGCRIANRHQFGWRHRNRVDRLRHAASNWARLGRSWRIFDLSVWLAAPVVPWHTFNLVGFGPVNFQARHSKYQGSCRQAETFSLLSRSIDLLGQALTFS